MMINDLPVDHPAECKSLETAASFLAVQDPAEFFLCGHLVFSMTHPSFETMLERPRMGCQARCPKRRSETCRQGYRHQIQLRWLLHRHQGRSKSTLPPRKRA